MQRWRARSAGKRHRSALSAHDCRLQDRRVLSCRRPRGTEVLLTWRFDGFVPVLWAAWQCEGWYRGSSRACRSALCRLYWWQSRQTPARAHARAVQLLLVDRGVGGGRACITSGRSSSSGDVVEARVTHGPSAVEKQPESSGAEKGWNLPLRRLQPMTHLCCQPWGTYRPSQYRARFLCCNHWQQRWRAEDWKLGGVECKCSCNPG